MNEEWNDWASKKVDQRAALHRDYQEMLRDCEVCEQTYNAVVEKRSLEEREKIEDYIAMCENVEYMRTQIAYEFGKEVGRKQAAPDVW